MQIAHKLPSYGLYKSNCHSSSRCCLAYLASKTSVRVVQFTNDGSVENSSEVEVSEQPIFFIQVYQDQKSVVHLLVGFLTKLVCYKINRLQTILMGSLRLQIDRNIVDFGQGLIGCCISEGMSSQGMRQFVAVTRNATIYRIEIANKASQNFGENKSKVEGVDKVVSICSLQGSLYLGNEEGCVFRVNVIKNTVSGTGYTHSKLPLLRILPLMDKQIVTCSCEGEIYIFNQDLSAVQIISIHTSVISRLLIHQDFIYSFGEDGQIRKFKYEKDQLKLVSTTSHNRMPGLVFTINGTIKYSLYDSLDILTI